jgi:hypothetical protein
MTLTQDREKNELRQSMFLRKALREDMDEVRRSPFFNRRAKT